MLCRGCGTPKRPKGKLVQRQGKFGKFYGCSTYPRCRHTEQLSYRGPAYRGAASRRTADVIAAEPEPAGATGPAEAGRGGRPPLPGAQLARGKEAADRRRQGGPSECLLKDGENGSPRQVNPYDRLLY